MFQDLLAKLYALELYYKTGHWQVKNSVFYADHLLLDRLSGEAGSRIDEVAEKAIGITGDVKVVNLPIILEKTHALVNSLPYANTENSKYFESSLKMEQSLLEMIKQVEPSQSVGVRTMLGDIADESESRIYLLKQRVSKSQAPI